jgi:nicotinamide-nucleotide amidase
MNLIQLAESRGVWLCTAESLTAGSLAAAIAAEPGASKAFLGSLVSYQDSIKSQLLGVSAPLIANQSAVDPEVCAQMAQGAVRKFAKAAGLDEAKVLAVSTTGVAGPDPVGDKAVGLVYLGLASGERVVVHELSLSGGRKEIVSAVVARALELVREELTGI